MQPLSNSTRALLLRLVPSPTQLSANEFVSFVHQYFAYIIINGYIGHKDPSEEELKSNTPYKRTTNTEAVQICTVV